MAVDWVQRTAEKLVVEMVDLKAGRLADQLVAETAFDQVEQKVDPMD